MPNQNQQQQSSATGEEGCELKAGHPPALKVGGVRVVQRTHSTSSGHEKEDEADVPEACSFAPKTIIKENTAGVPETLIGKPDKEAVKKIHDKPQPSAEYRGHSSKPNVIQQPRK